MLIGPLCIWENIDIFNLTKWKIWSSIYPPAHSHSQAYTHLHINSLSLTHTHTHTLSLSLLYINSHTRSSLRNWCIIKANGANWAWWWRKKEIMRKREREHISKTCLLSSPTCPNRFFTFLVPFIRSFISSISFYSFIHFFYFFFFFLLFLAFSFVLFASKRVIRTFFHCPSKRVKSFDWPIRGEITKVVLFSDWSKNLAFLGVKSFGVIFVKF